ncbi:MAG: GatB/YqeY domain-containing protein [Porticoccaceae bacterium]|nr:GatB/YqeY domain-containing protein [Porticoccaceae bacterium]|tara:strand:- start:208 stop:654 length:447 start_codon:yes stop_codon:yes gene_type:complete
MPLKSDLTTAMKEAMRAKKKARLGAIRLMLSEIKRVEVDERISVNDQRVLSILDKMVKQRRDSINQYQSAGRQELADIEISEINIIKEFLPTSLTNEEIHAMVSSAITESGAESMKDMGKVMNIIRPKIQGRADAGLVSGLVKNELNK